MVAIEAQNLEITYGDRIIVSGLDVVFPQGHITALLGPNGSGKSTVLRSLARLLPINRGTVYLHGKSIATIPTKKLARQLAMLPQSSEIPPGITVWELISYGRYPHQNLLGRLNEEDKEIIKWSIAVTGLEKLAQRQVDQLSGGERQRAWIAMALAQKTSVLLLDEPTTFLDIRHQLDVLNLVRNLNREHHITVGWVLHDLNQAAAYSDNLIMMKNGQILAQGDPKTVMTTNNIKEVFDVDMMIIPHPENGYPTCLPSMQELVDI